MGPNGAWLAGGEGNPYRIGSSWTGATPWVVDPGWDGRWSDGREGVVQGPGNGLETDVPIQRPPSHQNHRPPSACATGEEHRQTHPILTMHPAGISAWLKSKYWT